MSDDSQDKQLPASARKLDKARADGQVVRSKDLGHFLVLLAATGILIAMTPTWFDAVGTMLRAGLRFDARTVAAPDMMIERLSTWLTQGLILVIPLSLIHI